MFWCCFLSGCASLYHRRRRHLFARKSTTIHKINRTSKTEWDGKADQGTNSCSYDYTVIPSIDILLGDLKHQVIAATTFWRSIGCPRNGVVNDNRLQWKFRYKLAIKQAEENADQIFNQELYEYFNAKDDTAFWHAWRKKYCLSSLKTTSTLNGKQGDANVCNEFTEQFQFRTVFQTNTLNSDCVYEAEFSNTDFASEETNFPIESILIYVDSVLVR